MDLLPIVPKEIYLQRQNLPPEIPKPTYHDVKSPHKRKWVIYAKQKKRMPLL